MLCVKVLGLQVRGGYQGGGGVLTLRHGTIHTCMHTYIHTYM